MRHKKAMQLRMMSGEARKADAAGVRLPRSAENSVKLLILQPALEIRQANKRQKRLDRIIISPAVGFLIARHADRLADVYHHSTDARCATASEHLCEKAGAALTASALAMKYASVSTNGRPRHETQAIMTLHATALDSSPSLQLQ